MRALVQVTVLLEENKAVIRRLYEAVKRREWDSLDELFAPSYLHHSSPGHDMTLEELRQIMVATTGSSRHPLLGLLGHPASATGGPTGSRPTAKVTQQE